MLDISKAQERHHVGTALDRRASSILFDIQVGTVHLVFSSDSPWVSAVRQSQIAARVVNGLTLRRRGTQFEQHQALLMDLLGLTSWRTW